MTRIRKLALTTLVVAGVAGLAAAQGVVKWSAVSKGIDFGAGDGVISVAAGGTPAVVYAAVDGVGVFQSADLGATWRKLAGEGAANPCAVAAGGKAGELVFVAGKAGGLFRSEDGGKTWAKCTGLADENVESVVISTVDPNLVLVGHRAGKVLSVSPDSGKTWTKSDMGADMPAAVPVAAGPTLWVVASRKGAGIRVTADSGANWAAGTGEVQYHAGPIVIARAGDYLFTTKHHGLNKSVDGGKTWAYSMEEHSRLLGTAGQTLFREHPMGLREGGWCWAVQMSDDLGAHFSEVTGALPELVMRNSPAGVPPALTNLSPFVENRLGVAWAATPDTRSAFLSLGRYGLYCATLMWSAKGGPIVAGAGVAPVSVVEGDTKTKITVTAVATTRAGKIQRVFADLSSVGGGDIELLDDGQHNDGAAGDKTYGNTFTVAKGSAPGAKTIAVAAIDAQGNMASRPLAFTISSATEKMIVWDGDKFARGQGWCSPPTPLNWLKTQTDEAHGGKVALELRGEGGGWIGGGWNWHGWYPPNAGDDITKFANLSFWIKLAGDPLGGLTVGLGCNNKKATGTISAFDYTKEGEDTADGKWHEIVIPLRDLYAASKDDGFDPRGAWEFQLGSWAPQARAFSVFIDDIGFDNRALRSRNEMVSLPEDRAAAVLKQPVTVSAEISLAGAGKPVSKFIYGGAMGDHEIAKECGVTALRSGGNPVTPINWKKGFGAKGADWYYQNEGSLTAPENNWLVTFPRNNRKNGFATYFTLPMMGRVAKDGTSVAFDINKYPDQTSWAGKQQPTDRLPNAGSGIQFVRGPDGQIQKDKDGKEVTRLIDPDPNDSSAVMTPDEQCELFSFMVDKMKYGPAKDGGIQVVALDNEPCIWHATHRGMHPRGCSSDEIWEKTREYASRIKQIDPSVKVAGPTWFGWTAYFYSGMDQQDCATGKAVWEKAPDMAAHEGLPVTKWWLKQLAAYKKEKGVSLVDILDWHFYPQNGIYMGGTANDPKWMENRVQETRVLWDPDFVDPTWITQYDRYGKQAGGKLRILRLMKEWIAECNPGMETCLGEYNFGGERDASGGVAQSELFGIFAREGLDHAYLWFFPAKNDSIFFAFKMLRNPDGKGTAVGDTYLPAKVSASADVSVHTYRDAKEKRLSFVLVNLRAAKDAKVTLQLDKAIPGQEAAVYEYGTRDRFAIGRLPGQKVGGKAIEVSLPSMSVIRVDVKE